MQIEVRSINRIYNHLQDEKSRKIYANRVLYNLTGDYNYMINIFREITDIDSVFGDCIERLTSSNIVFYGAGVDLTTFMSLLPDCKVELICDRSEDKQHLGWNGIKVISPDELILMKDVTIAVCTSLYGKEIINELMSRGVSEDNIIDLGKRLEFPNGLFEEQYFEKEIMKPDSDEVFVDCGCFDCTTDESFIKWCGGEYKKIYAFEPDNENYRNCVAKSLERDIENIQIENAGVWSEDTILSFSAGHDQSAKIGSFGDNVINIDVKRIDSVVLDSDVTFIKMDVEGSELEALKGAKETIIRNHPKLAICLYHKPEDVFEIPEYILSLYDGYKFYVRHYQLTRCETVLYAIP